MVNDSEAYRVRQAEFLTSLFEEENGRPAEDAEEINNWIMSKSDEERGIIRAKLELHMQGGDTGEVNNMG